MHDPKEQTWTPGTIALSAAAIIAAGLVFLFLLYSLRSGPAEEFEEEFGARNKHRVVIPGERPAREPR